MTRVIEVTLIHSGPDGELDRHTVQVWEDVGETISDHIIRILQDWTLDVGHTIKIIEA